MSTDTLVFAGCLNTAVPHFANTNGRGIAAYSFDEQTGKLRFLTEFIDVANPTYLAIRADRRLLFATSELFGCTEGVVSAYRIDQATGALTFINRQSTRGSLSAHCNTDRYGDCVVVANYAHETPGEHPGQHVVSFPVETDGAIGELAAAFKHSGSGPDASRQGVSHAHCTVASADNRFVIVTDLGIDSAMTYRLKATAGRLEGPASVCRLPPGSGPRHCVFHPSGRVLYVANELNATVSRLAFNTQNGALSMLETVQGLPDQSAASSPPADIHIASDGRFLYASFRGVDCIATYALDSDDGRILSCSTRSSEGKTPRSFTLSPSGAYLLVANQDSDSIVTFRIDPKSGEPIEQVDAVQIGTPMCVKATRFV